MVSVRFSRRRPRPWLRGAFRWVPNNKPGEKGLARTDAAHFRLYIKVLEIKAAATDEGRDVVEPQRKTDGFPIELGDIAKGSRRRRK